MQWLEDPNWTNVDNLNSVRREASTYFRNKTSVYLKSKVNVHETNRMFNGWMSHFSQLLNVRGG